MYPKRVTASLIAAVLLCATSGSARAEGDLFAKMLKSMVDANRAGIRGKDRPIEHLRKVVHLMEQQGLLEPSQQFGLALHDKLPGLAEAEKAATVIKTLDQVEKMDLGRKDGASLSVRRHDDAIQTTFNHRITRPNVLNYAIGRTLGAGLTSTSLEAFNVRIESQTPGRAHDAKFEPFTAALAITITRPRWRNQQTEYRQTLRYEAKRHYDQDGRFQGWRVRFLRQSMKKVD